MVLPRLHCRVVRFSAAGAIRAGGRSCRGGTRESTPPPGEGCASPSHLPRDQLENVDGLATFSNESILCYGLCFINIFAVSIIRSRK